MSKPLELIVYPKGVGRHGEPVYIDEVGWAYRVSHVDGYAFDKRFTDAELAAEYWAAFADTNACLDYPDDSSYKTCAVVENTIHRFAILPHYDEPRP